jgi:type II secretory pathway pseudopilin PulG
MSNRSVRPGFALPAVLAVTGVVTLIFLVAITALASLTAEAASARARLRFTEAALTAEAGLAYVAATDPLRETGWSIGGRRTTPLEVDAPPPTTEEGRVGLSIDGRPYRTEGPHPLIVEIQDQGGTVNLAVAPPEILNRVLERSGVAPTERARLRARYGDYTDADSLRQVNGAEASDYADRALANRPLRRPGEWLSVLGMRDAVDPSDWRRTRPSLSTDPTSSAINLNTMSETTLELMFGLTPTQAATVVRRRNDVPFRSLDAVVAAAGTALPIDLEQTYLFPTGRMIYTIRDTRSAWVYRARLTLDPSNRERPLWIDQTEQTEAPGRAAARITDAAEFPAPPS